MNKINTTNQYLHFSYDSFTLDHFMNTILRNFKLNTTYTILLKISTNNNLAFKMCGPQIGIHILNEHNLEFYSELYELINIRIDSTLENYTYIDKVDGLEIMYSVIKPQEELRLKNVSNYSFFKPLVSERNTKKNFNSKLLPLTMDTSYFGIKVIPEDRQIYIDLILKNNLITKIDKDFYLKDSDEIFIYQSPNRLNSFIILSQNRDDINFVRYVFEKKTGIFVKLMKDSLICKKNQLFTRTMGNVTLTFENHKLKYYNVENKLQVIKSNKIKFTDRNINFGTFDLETFKDEDGLSKVYAIGFYTNIDEAPHLYYLTDFSNLDSQNFILNCLDYMLIPKYNKYIFYVHNLGGYDIVFLYNTLLNANLKKGYDYYNLSSTMRDNTFIRLDIKVKLNNKTIKISLVDSLNLLNFSLDKLTQDLNQEVKKGKFPHSFVSINTLNYIGNKPDIIYYDGISEDNYNLIPKNDWDLKKECLNYLSKDVLSLYSVMNEFSRLIYIYFNNQVTDALTITRLALNIFKQNYYENLNIPSINKIYLFNFIKEAYFGGITEVYIPYGKNLRYYDVNSLYPRAAKNPMPGNECYFIESFEEKGLDLDKLFGFFYCKVKTNNLYLGLLPVHFKNKLVSPNGEYFGIWCSEELKFAKSKGYDITVIKGYNFNKVDNIFNKYIDEIYKLKKDSTGFLKLIFKSLLNNLLGRFGLNIIKPITQTVSKERRDFIFSTRVVHSQTLLTENKFLITYDPIISNDICNQHGLNIIKVLEKESKLNLEKNLDIFKDVSIATAAFVTSYARIFMYNKKLEILENGGKIYYSDTDSLVVNNQYFDPKWIGTDIGLFKMEYDIKEGYFISNKTYCLILNNGVTVIKTKGVLNKYLTVDDFKSMYWKNQNITAIKSHTVKNYKDASVLIEKMKVLMDFDAYKKRTKIHNKKGIWINTEPLIINKN